MNATCNPECSLRVTWGPDPDWDLLTRVWDSTDTHGLNLYPLTSCCVQNHLWAPCLKSGPLLDRSDTRYKLKQGKNKVIGIQSSSDDTLHLTYLLVNFIAQTLFNSKKGKLSVKWNEMNNEQSQEVTPDLYAFHALSPYFFVQTAPGKELQRK